MRKVDSRGVPEQMTIDEQLELMVKIKNSPEFNIHPIDRKAVLIFLVANFIITTNEIFGGDRAKAMKMVDNFDKNIRDLVNDGIDSGGMWIEGIGSKSTQ
jgi:hypothetical protein